MEIKVDELRCKFEIVNRAMANIEYWEGELKKTDLLFSGKVFELNVYDESDDGVKDRKFLGTINIPMTTGYEILEDYKEIVTKKLEIRKKGLNDMLNL